MAKARNTMIYQLKVGLLRVRPPVWRRLEVVGGATLGDLHEVIQVAMGWGFSHLHSFDAGDVSYGEPDPEWLGEMQDERRVRVAQLLPEEGSRLHYTYDFGDDWRHEVLVERIGAPEAGVTYPRCTGGRRACPPEDCGGPWGYAEMLLAIADPTHEQHEEMLEWVGPDFDPLRFDANEVNALLPR